MPAQPQTTQPGETQPARTRQAAGPRGGAREGREGRENSARDASGPREGRGRRNPRRSPGPGRWGALQGGLGVCIIVASAAGGTIATIVTRNSPGFLLGLFVEAGTVVAALAVRPRAGRLIFPVPVLSYLVGALISGIVFDRSTGTSKTALALGAAQWVADGFFAMALATVLAVTITGVRWYLWRRRRTPARNTTRETARDVDWAVPASGATTRAAPPLRPRADLEPTAEPGYQAAPRGTRAQPGGTAQPGGRAQPGGGALERRRQQGAWDDADPRRGGRRPGPRSGTGPYNFSSGA